MRNLSLDQVKILLSVMVIANHSAFLKDFSVEWNYFFTQSVFRFSVPTFLIVGGFFFYRFLSKGGRFSIWFISLLLLHTAWSAIYLYFYVPQDASASEILIEVAKRYLEGYWHLWFTMAMLGAGTCLFLVRSLPDRALLYLSGLMFTCGLSIQYSGNYHSFQNIFPYLDFIFNKTHIYRNFLFVGFPFFTIGYLFCKNDMSSKISGRFCLIVFLASWLLLSLEGALNTWAIKDYRQSFDILAAQFLVAPSLFLLVLKSNRKTSSPIFSQVSAGVYFIHPLVLLLLPALLTQRILIFGATVVLSVFLALVITKLNKYFKFLL